MTGRLAVAAFAASSIVMVVPVARVASQSTSAPAALPPAAAQVLRDIRAADTGQLAVSEEDGRFLRVLAASTPNARALEIGGASGYSAIWIALGLRASGGHLTTIEYDAARAAELSRNIRRAGVGEVVTVVAGDAFAAIPRLTGEFDFVFLDAWKPDYRRFFDLVLPRLRPGGFFLAHNVVNKAGEMRDFLTAIHSHPAVLTSIVAPSSEGMSVSVKIR